MKGTWMAIIDPPSSRLDVASSCASKNDLAWLYPAKKKNWNCRESYGGSTRLKMHEHQQFFVYSVKILDR
ncbi:hypothetical protein EJD97_013294, partial [Solanum chilense]